MTDREQLETFLTAIDASALALRRPSCRGWLGDYQITGKSGHVLPDGTGFLIYVGWEGSPKRWTYAKKRLGFCRLAQDGDDEGCLHLDRLPTEPEAEIIRDVVGIRRKQRQSPETIERLRQMGFKPTP